MRFVYRPDGVEPRSWEFEPAKMMSPEAEAIERLTKMTFVQWQSSVQDGSMLAIRALLWVLLKRSNPGIKFESLEFSMGEIDWELGEQERVDVIRVLTAKQDSGEALTLEEAQLLEELTAESDDTGDDDPKEA